MPDLAETYSRSTGLKIDKPYLKEDFFPLPFERYITINSGSNQPTKNYDYLQTVLEILTPYLASAGISLVLLGGKDDPSLSGVYDLRGKTSYGQSYYLLRRAILHLGNDSWTIHAGGALNTPLVALYGSTDPYIHGPHWKPEKMRLLESHRWGRKPSFSQENPKTVNLICPFSVARAVLELLEIPHTLPQRTLNIGGAYNQSLLELIPNTVPAPDFNNHLPMVVRMDLEHNENILAQVFQTGRKVNVLTKAPINLGLLQQARPLILSFNFEMDENVPTDYVVALKKIVPNTTFFTRETDAVKVAALRFKFFDIVTIQQATDKTRADFEKACQEYTNDPTFSLDTAIKSGKMEFKSQKYVLSRGKIYLSHAHEKADIAVGAEGANSVRDEDVFYHDMNHWFVYST